MLSGRIKVTFEMPDQAEAEEGARPFIALDTMDVAEIALAQGLPDDSPLLNLIHQSGADVDLELLLEEHVMSWEPESRPAAADEVADWLEHLAKHFRKGSEALSLDLKPRHSLHGPR
ncbi:hypothetical protein [Pseudomonas chlororaphis]|uniref:hypothetical protein n=1 Tax=Pseudomonas chlororaphis TaxID=587753 RepID=UPI000F5809D4|nr:hypothetical protein [Pseudomonas chlororaphis]MBP5070210.1 hypothetical protein [Pseudomonas chlororaphis]